MSKEKTISKNEIQRALSGGEWSKALQYLEEYCAKNPKDFRFRQKLAELLERSGRKEESIGEYLKLAEEFAEQGYLIQAISLNKIILRIDPSRKDVNDRLAQLYAERYRESKPVLPLPFVPLFSGLNEQELQSLVSQVRTRSFEKDEWICREGESSDSLMAISRGEAVVFREIPEGRERRICNLKAGDFFGEFGFFTDRKRHAGVKAASQCEVLEISRNALQETIETHPHIRVALSDLYEQRVLDLFISASPLFSSLSGEERKRVFKHFRLVEAPQETLLFQGGEPALLSLPDQEGSG